MNTGGSIKLDPVIPGLRVPTTIDNSLFLLCFLLQLNM